MPKPILLSTTIPFDGFYESWYSQEIDREEEQEAEYFEEHRQAEDGVAEELRLTAGEYAEILFRFTDYSAAYQTIARDYAACFNEFATECLGFDPRLTFEEMTSPREYNFQTDRIFCHIPLGTALQLFAMSKANKHETLANVIAGRHTSRSGFVSFYDNRLAHWLEKPVRDWDHNELGTLLIACLCLAPDTEFDSNGDWRFRVFERVTEGETFCSAWSGAVNWPKVEAEVAELRADRLQELQEANPDYVAPPPRCPYTLDMFTGQPG